MTKTNFDFFLEEQLRDPDFAERFKAAGEAWDVALQISRSRKQPATTHLAPSPLGDESARRRDRGCATHSGSTMRRKRPGSYGERQT